MYNNIKFSEMTHDDCLVMEKDLESLPTLSFMFAHLLLLVDALG